MERSAGKNDIMLLFDNYNNDSKSLHTSFLLAGQDCPAVVIEDNGFLPENVTSVYGYFMGDFSKQGKYPGRPLYFNEVRVPDYWEISGNNSNGAISYHGKTRGKIFYAEPLHKRQVLVVDWYDEAGVVRASDHYNRYGALCGRTVFNAKGQKVNRSFFSPEGKEVIVENFVTGNLILNEKEEVHIFRTKTDLVVHFLKRTGLDQKRIFFNSLSTPFFASQALPLEGREDVLFWQEPARNDIPGNMQIILGKQGSRAKRIYVQKRQSYDKMTELGVDTKIVKRKGFVYPFERENMFRKEILICTNSDRIEQLQKLIEELSDFHFHIAALTEMSTKLTDMEKYENVSLYPNIPQRRLDTLFETCDWYLDINYETEIVSAVRRAFLNNMLILGFKETLHQKDYIAPEHIYDKTGTDQMIADIKAIQTEKSNVREHLALQRAWALTEDKETFTRDLL